MKQTKKHYKGASRQESNEHYEAKYLAEISDGNRPAAAEFLTTKKGQGVKSGSRVNYALALRQLDHEANGKAWKELDHRDTGDFMARLRSQSYSNDTIRMTGACLKHFLRWERDSDLPPKMILSFRIKSRKLPPRPVLTEEEEALLMEAARHTRDQVIIALLTEGGFRVNELVNVNLGNVKLDDKGGAWITQPDLQEGLKTGPRPTYITKFRPLLEAYMLRHVQRCDENAPLLLAYDYRHQPRPGIRLGTQGIWTALNRLQKATGIRHFRPHDLRHTAITRAHEAGLDPIDLSERFWGVKLSRQVGNYTHDSDLHKERIARKAAGVDMDGNGVQSLTEAQADLIELRKLWTKVMGTDLPSKRPGSR